MSTSADWLALEPQERGARAAGTAFHRLGPWAAVALVAVSTTLLLVGADVPYVALLPILLVVGLCVAFGLSPRVQLLALMVSGLCLEIPQARPSEGLWTSPLYDLGRVLYDNLNKVTGIAPLRFALIEALLVFVLVRVLVRMVLRRWRRETAPTAVPVLLLWGLAVWLGTIIWLEVWGIGRGGDVRNSLWQFRALLWVPIVGWLFATTLRGARDYLVIARILLAAASYKVLLGIAFVVIYCLPHRHKPAYVTSHDDTILYVAAITVMLSAWIFQRTRAHSVLLVTVLPWLMVGIQMNNRRIAFVSLFGALFVMYTLLPGKIRRTITMVALAASPLFVVYLIAGMNREGGIFAPAHKIMSVLTQKDASSGTRDIENLNLFTTLKYKGLLLGSGFGHEYIEVSVANDISKWFPQYRYIAHNSVLWLWSIGGLVGITLLFAPLVIAVFLAARSYHAATQPMHRTAAITCIGVIFLYLVQAYGDMGTQGWMGVWVMGSTFGLIGHLATDTGAWPADARLRLFTRRRVARVAIAEGDTA